MDFFGSPPIKPRDAIRAIRASVGDALYPDDPSPPAPTVAPPHYNELDGKPHPILVWSIGPYAPKDMRRTDMLGWCYDAAGHWWQVYAPAYKREIGAIGGGFATGLGIGDVDNRNVYRGQNGYVFSVALGPPVFDSGGDFLSQVGDAFAKVIIPVAIGILTIVQPEIGIAAALVYSKVALIASGAPLSAIAFSTMSDAVKSQIPSTTGKGLFDEGVSAAGSLPQVKAARDKVNALGSVAVEALGLKKSFESGLAIGQSKLIQQRAVQIIRAQLADDYDRSVLDTAIANNAAITDVALGMFPTAKEGAARLNNAIAQATIEVDPGAKGTVKLVPLPTVAVAQSGKTISKSPTGASKGGGSSSGPGLGTFIVVGAGGYALYKFWPKIMSHFSRPGQPARRK